jgi:hypothetical protein
MPGLVIGVTTSGEIAPPPDVLRRLAQIHPGLSLKHFPTGGQTHFSFTLAWPPDDPRHELVRTGEIAPDRYDVIGWVPVDVRLDEIPGYAARSLSQSSRADAKAAVADIARYNAALTEARLDAKFAAVNDAAEVMGSALLGKDRVKVYQSEPKGRVRRQGVKTDVG